MFKGAVAATEVVDLLGRYQDAAPHERQSVKNWLAKARHVQFAQLLSDPQAAANLTRARAVDAELRQALQAQARRQLRVATGAFLTVAVLAMASV
jgi:hypothetical protein